MATQKGQGLVRRRITSLSKQEREAAELVRRMEEKKAYLVEILVRQGLDAFMEYRRNAPEEVIDLSGIEIPGIIVCGIDLNWAILRSTVVTGADFSGAKLKGADLQGMLATATIFKGALLQGADLRSAILTNADLSTARLLSADLRGAILTKANLRNADLTGADLIGANLVGAQLEGAKFAGAMVAGMGLSPGTPFPPGAIVQQIEISTIKEELW